MVYRKLTFTRVKVAINHILLVLFYKPLIKYLYIITTALSLTLNTSISHADEQYYDKAIIALESEDFDSYLSLLNQGVTANQADSILELGIAYLDGDYTEQNNSKALTLIKTASDLGLAEAQNELGYLYLYGVIVEKDYQRALELFNTAAKSNDPHALYNLGIMYSNGWGVKKDLNISHEYHLKSASLNYEYSMYEVGGYYDSVESDYSSAFKWYLKAAKEGLAIAQFDVATMYEEGLGVSQDHTQAILWYTKSAEQGNSDAENNLGRIYYEGKHIKQDLEKAYELFKSASEDNQLESFSNLAYMYDNGEYVQEDDAHAFRLYFIAAENGDEESQFRIASMYENGVGTDYDLNKALYWYQKAYSNGNIDAVNLLAGYYSISSDFAQLEKLYLEVKPLLFDSDYVKKILDRSGNYFITYLLNENKIAEAIKLNDFHLNEAIDNNSFSVAYYTRFGIYLQQGHYQLAEEYLLEAINYTDDLIQRDIYVDDYQEHFDKNLNHSVNYNDNSVSGANDVTVLRLRYQLDKFIANDSPDIDRFVDEFNNAKLKTRDDKILYFYSAYNLAFYFDHEWEYEIASKYAKIALEYIKFTYHIKLIPYEKHLIQLVALSNKDINESLKVIGELKKLDFVPDNQGNQEFIKSLATADMYRRFDMADEAKIYYSNAINIYLETIRNKGFCDDNHEINNYSLDLFELRERLDIVTRFDLVLSEASEIFGYDYVESNCYQDIQWMKYILLADLEAEDYTSSNKLLVINYILNLSQVSLSNSRLENAKRANLKRIISDNGNQLYLEYLDAKTTYEKALSEYKYAISEINDSNIIKAKLKKVIGDHRKYKSIDSKINKISLFNNIKTVDMAALQEGLIDNEIYIHTNSSVDDINYIILISKNSFDIKILGMESEQLSLEISNLTNSLNQGTARSFSELKPFDIKASNTLYQTLIENNENLLSDKKRIIINSNNILQGLPWKILVKQINEQPTQFLTYKESVWFAHDKNIVYAPSISFITSDRSVIDKIEEPILAIGPYEDSEAETNFTSSLIDKIWKTLTFQGSISNLHLKSLPDLPSVKNQLNKLFQNTDTNLLLSGDANIENILNELEKNYKYIAFATHYLPTRTRSQYPGLVVKSSDGKSNILLTSEDVYLRNIKADWVMLLACNTLAEEDNNSINSLLDSFLYAGAKRLLVSSWPVDVHATKELMNLIGQLSRSHKLTKSISIAPKELRRLAGIENVPIEYSHPIFWGAFTVVGYP